MYVVYQLYWGYSNPQKKDTMITTLVGGLIKFYLFFDFGGDGGLLVQHESPLWLLTPNLELKQLRQLSMARPRFRRQQRSLRVRDL